MAAELSWLKYAKDHACLENGKATLVRKFGRVIEALQNGSGVVESPYQNSGHLMIRDSNLMTATGKARIPIIE